MVDLRGGLSKLDDELHTLIHMYEMRQKIPLEPCLTYHLELIFMDAMDNLSNNIFHGSRRPLAKHSIRIYHIVPVRRNVLHGA